jgi:peptide/nickel transport system substrate-binding protein
MSRNRITLVVGLLVAFSMLLASCGPTPTATPGIPTIPPTAEPTAVPARTGAWVDQVVFTGQDSAEAAVTQIQAGDIDIYAYSVSDPALFDVVKNDANLGYTTAFGSYTELTMNPVLNFADGRLNPLGDPIIREAVNWLVDREYIAKEIYGGLANVKVSTLNSAFPDYALYIDTMRAIENKYAFNLEKATQVISDEMTVLGAEMVDGKWMFDNAPVTLIAIIRTEDERKEIGDYASSQFETVGFTVDRQYKTRSEASPIWNQSNPEDGLWNFYTGGWITTAVSRDDATNFGYFYTALGGAGPLPQHEITTPEFQTVCDKLWTNDFASMDERGTLFKTALELSLQHSGRVWLVDQVSFSPMKANLAVTYDLAGGVAGAQMWPYTLRFKDSEGGTVKWAQPGVLVEPWNALAGSNWIYDQTPMRATQDYGAIFNPYTGLLLPQRIESAAIVAKTGLPIGKTLDWVTLDFADTIEVPADAWADWDATTQTFIPAGAGVTANIKSTVVYPADLFTTVKWHDGSPISVGDFVMYMIMLFDPGKPESAIYDEAQAPNVDAFLSHVKGIKITSTDPLTIEFYDDMYLLDAENNVATFWPNYGYGSVSWSAHAIGIMADAAKELAFSTDKAGILEVEWMSYIAGPSLDILTKNLAQAATDKYIPYAATLGQYVTADEAAARYANLQAWYAARGHYWVGLGPFFLYSVFPVEKTLLLQRNPDFVDPADKWAGFAAPKIPVVDLTGPASVKIGDEATFDVMVSFDNAPYPQAELAGVKYLVYDATGALVTVGEATFVADGQYQIKVPTSALAAGSNKIEVAVTSKLESIPAMGSVEFVTTP